MEKSNENAILWGLIERIGIIIVLAGALTLIIPSLIGAQSNYTLLAGAGILVLGAIAHIVVTMLAIDKDSTSYTIEEEEEVTAEFVAAAAEEKVEVAAEEKVEVTTEEPAKVTEVVAEKEKAIKVE